MRCFSPRFLCCAVTSNSYRAARSWWRVLSDFAHYVEGTGQKSVSVEAGLMDMLQRMESGRFKVFKHLNDWWEEFRLYHRKDGKVVKEGDDLMCATRYALMMLRFASTARNYHNFRRPLVYQKNGYF